jgi:hypothetical protein
LQENHPPHLALFYAFITLFQKMQGELNKKTKEHLKFFFTEVLKINAASARPDSVHVVFEIQKLLEDQYEQYLVTKGSLLNAGRDEKNADIIFATDDEIVVNETQVAELKTLFLDNHQTYDETYVEGVYIAPFANKSDGVDKDFKEEPKNWYTLGNRVSKFIEPGKKTPKSYPNARLGFALASPVLYLNEGKRTVAITVACQLESLCEDPDRPKFVDSKILYKTVRKIIDKGFYLITTDLIEQAAVNGVPEIVLSKIRKFLPDLNVVQCYPQPPVKKPSVIITEARWRTEFYNTLGDPDLQLAISEIFKVRKIFKVKFSGAEQWIEPSKLHIELHPFNLPANNQFTLKIKAKLFADKPAVTFFDKDALKEELGTTLPVVKVELDEELKILRGFTVPAKKCCLQKTLSNQKRDVSFYHFFRDITVLKNANGANTRIDVKVCGLKNFIVQNDENVMDVNSPIYPFGTRPKIDSNFYIGSEEIFLKNWSGVWINLNWKDLPPPIPNANQRFETYYNGYQTFMISSGLTMDKVIDSKFKVQFNYLLKGQWFDNGTPVCNSIVDLLFEPKPIFPPIPPACDNSFYAYQYEIFPSDFITPPALHYDKFEIQNLKRFDVNSRNGFLKLTLKCQDFQHDKYAFVLARQMSALGKLPELVDGAVYFNITGPNQYKVLNINDVLSEIVYMSKLANDSTLSVGGLGSIRDKIVFFNGKFALPNTVNDPGGVVGRFYDDINKPPFDPVPAIPTHPDLRLALDEIFDMLQKRQQDIDKFKGKGVVIPNAPWTPTIANMSIDYTATAKMEDLELIHLYPYNNTYKAVELGLKPTLFPLFCDEGHLFIGLRDFQPGSNLNILFQLAEATADSETGEEKLSWHFLDSNNWRELRTGFEVLEDKTFKLTASGIIKFALPGNMTNDNTIMPRGLYWIKASAPKNSKSVSETIALYTQAIKATFKLDPANDTSRLAIPLEAGKIAKLLVADPAIKLVSQPAGSFDGKLPELESTYYLRVSERLRHKGRAIQKWDYERLVLEEFPEIFKVKCINHSFHTDAHIYENDVPYAPGYVMLAVIPDLNKLKAGNSFEPRAPVSLLEKINKFLSKKTSPFVRFKAVNPRYEQVHFCITVRLILKADKNFFKEKLKTDLREFLAPWAIGKYDKLSFGQPVYRSDVLRFLERTTYIDFIRDIRMKHESDSGPMTDKQKVLPLSPRSILIAGNIDVLIDKDVCDNWCHPREYEERCDKVELVNDYCRPEID